MALSTSTSSLAVGASRTFNLSLGSALTLVAPPNCRVTVTETPNTVSASGVGGNASRVHNLQLPQTVTYGPYPMGGTVVVENASNSGGAVTWVRSDALVAESASGAVSLVSGDGPLAPSIFITASGDQTGATDSAKIAAAVAAAVAEVKASGRIVNIVLSGADYWINDTITVNDGILQDYPTPDTGNITVGPNLYGLGKGLTRIHMMSAGKPAVLFHCKTANTHLSNFRIGGFSLFGPGGSNAETVGVQIGGITQSASEDFEIADVQTEDFVVGMRFENVCNGTIRRCLFGGYTRGCEFGYNADTLLFEECRWGDENDASTTGVALSYTYRSPFHPTGGLAINAHTFANCWFMRQTVVADIQDRASSIVFDTCYYERCKQYAKLGTSGSATGVRGVFWRSCHFSQPYDATDTAAKIEVQHSSDDSLIGIQGCRTDDTQGAYVAWVKVGADTSLGWTENILPAPSGHPIISYSGRNIDTSSYHQLQLNRRVWAVFDHSLGGNIGHTFEAYNASYSTGSETQIARFVNVNKSSGSVNSSAQVLTLASDTVCFAGAVRPRRSTALPTATVQWEGVLMTVQGGAGVASVTSVCLKSAADTYSWKTLATG